MEPNNSGSYHMRTISSRHKREANWSVNGCINLWSGWLSTYRYWKDKWEKSTCGIQNGFGLINVIFWQWTQSNMSSEEDKNGSKTQTTLSIKALHIITTFGACQAIWMDNKNSENKLIFRTGIIVFLEETGKTTIFTKVSILLSIQNI